MPALDLAPATWFGIGYALVLLAVAYGIDKMKAESGRWRISESTLLMLALVGGSLGAYAGRAAFRHKTRKPPFSGQLHGIAVFQALILAIGGGWLAAG